VRILIADDHEIVRRGICAILTSNLEWKICGEAVDGREAVEKTQELTPDLIILDIAMPRLNGLDAARQILRRDFQQRILILTALDTPELVIESFVAGVRGFVLKSNSQDLEEAVQAVSHGHSFFKGRIGRLILSYLLDENEQRSCPKDEELCVLTPREREIVQLLAEGLSTKEVAAVLKMSVKTAATHRNNAMSKIGAHCLPDLICYCVRKNIVALPVPIQSVVL